MKIVTEKVGKNLTKNYREDYGDVVIRFKQFAHISQFANIPRSASKLPTLDPKFNSNPFEFRIDSSPLIGKGEMVFGVDPEGNMTWLAEIIDSSD